MKQDYKHYIEKKNKIFKAFVDKNYGACKVLIENQLALTEKLGRNWNNDNSRHLCYTYLGLIAIEENRPEKAKDYLLRSGEISGSPQLKSFGPNMLLAKKLLEKGEKESVMIYLEECSKFWLIIFRHWKISRWKRKIRNNEIPNFGSNLVRHLNFKEKVSVSA